MGFGCGHGGQLLSYGWIWWPDLGVNLGCWNNFLLGLWVVVENEFLIDWIYYFNILNVKIEDMMQGVL